MKTVKKILKSSELIFELHMSAYPFPREKLPDHFG